MYKIEYDGRYYCIYKREWLLFIPVWTYVTLRATKEEAEKVAAELKEYPKYV